MALTNLGQVAISQEVFAAPRKTAINTDIFSTAVNEFRTQSDTVKVDILGAGGAVVDLNPSGGEGFNKDRTNTEAFKNVTLSTPRLAGFSLSPEEYINLTEKGFRERVVREAAKLENDANSVIYATILAAAYTKSITVGVAGAFDTDVIGTINANDDYLQLERSIDPAMVLVPAHFQNLMSQPSLINASDRGATDINRGGVPFVDYRDNRMYQSSILTNNAENLAGFVTDRGGICVGFGIESDMPKEDQVNYFSDVVSTSNGIPIRFTHTVDANSKRHNFNWTLTMGVTVAQPDKLIRLVTA